MATIKEIDGVTHIEIEGGKYTLILDPGNLRALRYGEPWRSLIGDGFIMSLGQEIEELQTFKDAWETSRED